MTVQEVGSNFSCVLRYIIINLCYESQVLKQDPHPGKVCGLNVSCGTASSNQNETRHHPLKFGQNGVFLKL